MSKDELLQAGIAAVKAGNRSQAAGLFMQVVKLDPASEQGWLGLGYCLPEQERRVYCFQRVLAINPDNRIARSEMARLTKQSPFVENSETPKPTPAFNSQAQPAILSKEREPAKVAVPAPRAAAPAAEKPAQPRPAARKKKKSNLPQVAFFGVLAVLLLVVILGVGYWLLNLNTASLPAAAQPALPAQASTSTPVPATPSPTPTPNPPTPIPSPLPTIVYRPVYESAPCPFDAPITAVTCGYLTVPESRTGDPSRTIKLAVAVYRSRSQNPAEPVVFLQGGPGGAAVELSADAYDFLVDPFLDRHDLIVFDQRGTGLSDPVLDCEELKKMYVQDIRGLIDASTRSLVYTNAVRSCNGLMLGVGIQLQAYTTVESAADFRDLLAVLGYPKANLYGASYGTRLAQVIMREYPEIVNTAILDSVVPIETSVFKNYSNSMMSGLETLFTNCARDPQCNAAYPNLEATFWELVKELDENPVTVTSSNYPTGLITQTVTGETLINLVLGSIKYSYFIGTAPQTISRFKDGDFSTLVMQQSSLLFMFDSIAPGLFINMTCHEQVLATTLEEAHSEANRQIIRDYSWLPFFGDVGDIYKICTSWKAIPPAYGENDPVISDIPTLIITGSYDPTTPPGYGQQIRPNLSNHYYFEFPNLGHVPTSADSTGCATDIMRQFLANPSREPDRACMGSLESPVFVVPYTGEPAIALETARAYGFRLSVPAEWYDSGDGFYYRGNSPFDITEIGILRLPVSISNIRDYFSQQIYGYRGLDGPLVLAGQQSINGFNWQFYTSSSYGRPVDIAMFEERGLTTIIMQFCNKDEHDALYRTVFLPMVTSVKR